MAKLPVEKLKPSKSSKAPKAVPVTIVSEPSPATKSDGDRERKWRTEDALRDIERAEGHKRDKQLMGDVKKLAQEKVNSLKNLC